MKKINQAKMKLNQLINKSIRLKNLNNIDYIKLIEGKSIAIIGPAIYLKNKNYGLEIDKHDVVVRINRGCELIKEHSNDIGSRTDVMYSCLIEKPENAGEIDINKFKTTYGIKYLCATPYSKFNGVASSNDLDPKVNKRKFNRLSLEIPSRIIDYNFWNEINSKINSRPTTGYIAIFDLLRFNPKKVKIFGYSFYLTDTLKGYKKGITGITSEELNINVFNSKRHNQFNMWKYAKQSLLDNSIIELDPLLKKILTMSSFSREEFNKIIKINLE